MEGDKTVAELIKAYRADRDNRHGAESTTRKYKHIFEALELGLGADKPIRAISREDFAEKVQDLIRTLPVQREQALPEADYGRCHRAGG